jgi:hypothetical protein
MMRASPVLANSPGQEKPRLNSAVPRDYVRFLPPHPALRTGGVSTFFRVAAFLQTCSPPCSVTGHSFSPCWLSFCQISEAVGKLFRFDP